MKKYKMIQISEEAHSKLKEYCIENDKTMGKVIERYIESITKKKTAHENILRVQNNR